MSPVAGMVRLRKHQFGRQSAMGTPAAASRAYGWTGVPSVNLNWTDPEVDLGSRDPVAAPYRVAPEITWTETTPALRYDDLPRAMCAIFGGGVAPTGGGTAKTWTHKPSSTTVDEPDLFTGEFGDDVASDWFQLSDGLATKVEFTGEEGLGPVTGSIDWLFGAVRSTGSTDAPVVGTVPTPGLSVPPDDAVVYLKDMSIWVGHTIGGLAKVSDALHAVTCTISQEVDQKRYANGAQTFDVDEYGPGARQIEITGTWAKKPAVVGTGSLADDWMSDDAVNGVVRLVFTSRRLAQAPSTYYGWQVTIPVRYYTREDAEAGGNAVVNLAAHGYYDAAGLAAAFESVLVCTLSGDDLGQSPS